MTVKFVRMLATVLLFNAFLIAATPWTPANFRGLTLGQAHREDIVRALGNPDSATRTASGEELTYKSRGDHMGDLTVHLDRSSRAVEIDEAFPIAIPRTHIYQELGKDAQTAHFSWSKCAPVAIYQDPHGPLELTLYPSRGIALWPDQLGYDFAALHYLVRSPGLAHPPSCVSKH